MSDLSQSRWADPAPPPAPEMTDLNEFAQTRGADDLFDDEIIPVAAEEQPQPQVEVAETVEAPREAAQPAHTEAIDLSHGHGTQNARKRGAPLWQRGQRRTSISRSSGSADNHEAQTVSPTEKAVQENDRADSPAKPTDASANKHVPAVRGDRSGTGGVRKPKLTNEELEKKVASARENAAKVAAAHARAQADRDSFLEREKVAAEKRRQENEHRRVLDSERAQNRQRKLNAATGREWDAAKHEEDHSMRGRGQYRRGMHGGVTGHTRHDFDEKHWDAAPRARQNHPRGRGRGGRRGNSRGRGDYTSERASSEPEIPPPAPAVTSETEFPSLHTEKKNDSPAGTTAPPVAETESKSPVTTGGSWAEQVEENN